MISPAWKYYFQRCKGTRYNLLSWEGPGCYSPLFGLLKREKVPIVYLNKDLGGPNQRKPLFGLYKPGKVKSEKITGIFEPSPDHPGRGFGDVSRKDALLIRRNEETATLEILVFPGLGMQSLNLFLYWISSMISEVPAEMLNNNVSLDTKIETHD